MSKSNNTTFTADLVYNTVINLGEYTLNITLTMFASKYKRTHKRVLKKKMIMLHVVTQSIELKPTILLEQKQARQIKMT